MDNDLFYNMYRGDIHNAAPIFDMNGYKMRREREIPQVEFLRDFACAVYQMKGENPKPDGLKPKGLNPKENGEVPIASRSNKTSGMIALVRA